METVAALIGAAGAVIGVLLRKYLRVTIGRWLLLVGASALLLGIGAFALVYAGRVNIWVGAASGALLLAVGIFVVPMSLMLIRRRSEVR